jgi:hypothetical protein
MTPTPAAAGAGSPSAMPTATGAGGAMGVPTGTATAGTGDPPPPPPPPPAPTCGDVGHVNPVNAPGTAIGTTKLYTDWTWPAAIESIEWDLVIEVDPPLDGYYWAHQFSFAEGNVGYFGLQANGGFQLNPPNGDYDWQKMVVFWIGGAPTGELGDIVDPDARAATIPRGGIDWMTIHAKYAWEACHLYHLKLAKESVTDEGDSWYGFWISDRSTDVDTFFGRILVPAAAGELQSSTMSFTNRIDEANLPYTAVVTCDDPYPASGIFGWPTANDGSVSPMRHYNHFLEPMRCPTSRFTELTSGVRQEIGLAPLP